jgi:dolichyl-phosphate beta-glucosyltransferase
MRAPQDPTMTTLSLILPCYNEAERLPATLGAHLAQLAGDPGQVEVVIVDDGSTDATAAVAEAVAAADARVRVIRTEPNHGKGFAVRTGMLAASGELLVFTDADGSYGPGEVERVVSALADHPVAIGTRVHDRTGATLGRRIASRVFNRTLRLLLRLPFRDTQCGLKGFRREVARELFGRARVDGFAFDVEVLLLARRLGLAVAEVPVRAQERDGSRVRLLLDGRRMLGEVWAARQAAASEAAVTPVSALPFSE